MTKLSDIVIKKAGGKIYDIFRPDFDCDPDSGSDIVIYPEEPNFKILAYIQPTGSEGNIKGIQLKNATSGDFSIAEYFMYTNQQVFNKDRLMYNNKKYEVRSVENWESIKLSHFKSYLVEVDVQ